MVDWKPLQNLPNKTTKMDQRHWLLVKKISGNSAQHTLLLQWKKNHCRKLLFETQDTVEQTQRLQITFRA